MSWQSRYEDDTGSMVEPRLFVAYWLVRTGTRITLLGTRITRLGDWLGGW